jgi:hypothetical protein
MTEISIIIINNNNNNNSIYPHQHCQNNYHYYQCSKQLMMTLKIEEEQLGKLQIITEERIHYIDDY